MSATVLPAPSGGWNARDSLAEMASNEASKLINWVPYGDGVKSRPGHAAFSSSLSAAVQTLVTYHGSTETIIAGVNGKLLNMNAAGGGVSLGTGFNSNKWQTTEFKNRMIFCNSGTDAVQDWDGTTLTATSISGATSADLSHATTHKGRVIYIEKDSQSFWYPSAGAYAGAMTEFDLSEFTTTGGYLLYLISWSRDGGSGVDDLAAFVFDTGEVIVYAGSDPGSSTDWAMLGRFLIGAPLGRKSAIKVGGDVIIATVEGYVPLSAALQEGSYSEQAHFSYMIDPAVKEAAQKYKSNFGWEAVHWPQASMFLVNVPISATESVQHQRNTTKGGWSKFQGMDASCFTVYASNLYFGSPDGYIYKVAGSSDQGAFIPFEGIQAFNYFGGPHRKKQITAVEPITSYGYPKYITSHWHADHNITVLDAYDAPPEPVSADWDVGEWDVASWVNVVSGAKTARRNSSGMGYALAHEMRLKSRSQTITWHATHVWLKPAGIV